MLFVLQYELLVSSQPNLATFKNLMFNRLQFGICLYFVAGWLFGLTGFGWLLSGVFFFFFCRYQVWWCIYNIFPMSRGISFFFSFFCTFHFKGFSFPKNNYYCWFHFEWKYKNLYELKIRENKKQKKITNNI